MSDVTADAILENVLKPILGELHSESGQHLKLSVLISGLGEPPLRRIAESAPSKEGRPNAEGEVRILTTRSDHVVRFEAESIIKGLSQGSGFSGFSLRGKVDLGSQPPKTRLFSKTNRYNVWNWGRKFRLSSE